MFKELWFEDGYYICGTFTSNQIREMKNFHGLIIRERSYRQ